VKIADVPGIKRRRIWKLKLRKLKLKKKKKNIRDLYRGISDFKKGYQPRTNIVRDEMGDLITDSHSILARCGNNFSHLFNVHGFINVRQTEVHTTEPLAPEPSAFEVQLATKS
jgi:hypothetical protein